MVEVINECISANLCVVQISRAIIWGVGSQQLTAEEANLKKSFAKAVNGSANGSANGSVGTQVKVNGQVTTPKSTQNPIYDVFDLSFGVRGIGWEFGTNPRVYLPKDKRPLDQGRLAFVTPTIKSLLIHFILLDCVDCFMKTIPGVNTPEGGTIFLSSLPPLQRYALSFVITYWAGHIIPFCYTAIYDFGSLVMVGIFNDDPALYPPMFDSPWTANSVSSFWGKTWHQIVRQCFFFLGGWPAQYIFGAIHPSLANTGLLFGTFFGSGVFHSLVLIATSGQMGFGAMGYFMLQACFVAFERILYAATGYKFRGWLGYLWSVFGIVVMAHWMGEIALLSETTLY